MIYGASRLEKPFIMYSVKRKFIQELYLITIKQIKKNSFLNATD